MKRTDERRSEAFPSCRTLAATSTATTTTAVTRLFNTCSAWRPGLIPKTSVTTRAEPHSNTRKRTARGSNKGSLLAVLPREFMVVLPDVNRENRPVSLELMMTKSGLEWHRLTLY
jgi:hypothetical protein